MSTRAFIRITEPEREEFIYRHTDGYPENVKRDLIEVNNQEPIDADEFATYLLEINNAYKRVSDVPVDVDYVYTVLRTWKMSVRST